MTLRLITTLCLLFFLLHCAEEPRAAEAHAAGYDTFTSFDGQMIAYQQSGEGPAVMLLHGFINDGSNWRNTQLYDQLITNGYRVIIPDMRGCGYSAKPHTDEAYANDAEVKDLMLLADLLELETYAAVGYSRGSIVLAKLLTEDKRVTRAVIGGMGIDFTNPDWPRRKKFAAAFKGQVTPEAEAAVAYAKSVDADFEVLHLLQKHQPVALAEELRGVTIPVLVAIGSADNLHGDPGALERLFPNGKLAMMPGEHNTVYNTQVFVAAVMTFMKSGR